MRLVSTRLVEVVMLGGNKGIWGGLGGTGVQGQEASKKEASKKEARYNLERLCQN